MDDTMTRYNDNTSAYASFYETRTEGYRMGVDRVLEYIESIHAYPKLHGELLWAIREGII